MFVVVLKRLTHEDLFLKLAELFTENGICSRLTHQLGARRVITGDFPVNNSGLQGQGTKAKFRHEIPADFFVRALGGLRDNAAAPGRAGFGN